VPEAAAGRPFAIIAGGGALPRLAAEAAAADGRRPVLFPIAGEADPVSFGPFPVHVLKWGEIGRMLRLMRQEDCREALLIGAIARRPDYRSLRPDLGAVRLVPRIMKALRGGDASLLSAAADMLLEEGIRLIGPLDVAPGLAMPAGLLASRMSPEAADDVAKAAEAARAIGRLDIGQGAVAVQGRVVAVEDAGGTDGLLERLLLLRQRGRIPASGGVLVKCPKPHQDLRLDVPTVGPATAEAARRAGLEGVAAEAGRTLLAGRSETVEAFRRAGVFLLGLPRDGND